MSRLRRKTPRSPPSRGGTTGCGCSNRRCCRRKRPGSNARLRRSLLESLEGLKQQHSGDTYIIHYPQLQVLATSARTAIHPTVKRKSHDGLQVVMQCCVPSAWLCPTFCAKCTQDNVPWLQFSYAIHRWIELCLLYKRV